MSDDDDPPDRPVDDADDPERPATETAAGPQRKARETRRLKIQRERIEFWQGVLANPVGRREVWALLFASDSGHPFETRFPCGPVGFPDANAAWYGRGEQDLARRQLDALMVAAREGVLAMLDEHDPRFASAQPKRPKVTDGRG